MGRMVRVKDRLDPYGECVDKDKDKGKQKWIVCCSYKPLGIREPIRKTAQYAHPLCSATR